MGPDSSYRFGPSTAMRVSFAGLTSLGCSRVVEFELRALFSA